MSDLASNFFLILLRRLIFWAAGVSGRASTLAVLAEEDAALKAINLSNVALRLCEGFSAGRAKILFGVRMFQYFGGFVIFRRCLLSGVPGTQPKAFFTSGVSDLRSVATPLPLSHANVMDFLGGISVAIDYSFIIGIAFLISRSHGGRL